MRIMWNEKGDFMAKSNQPYRYLITDSIVNGNFDYELSQEEYYQLYSFYVTYSLCENQSHRRRTFSDYGWQTEKIQLKNHSATDLGKVLKSCMNLSDSNFIFNEKDSLKILFKQNHLEDGILSENNTERCVIGKTNAGNRYLKVFYRIRNCLAHGKFLLKYSSTNERMIVFQDDNRNNVTARMIFKLSTLINIVYSVDKNNIIIPKRENVEKDVA